MSGSTISGTVDVGVTLGSGTYTSPLTITGTGAILPGGGTGAALYSNIAGTYDTTAYTYTGGTIVNDGTVVGASASGAYAYAGNGAALDRGTLVNAGFVSGGTAAFGGVGVQLQQATLINSGTVTAGGGEEAAGVFLYGGRVLNTGTIIGGLLGDGVNSFGGSITNDGTILANQGDGVAFGDSQSTLVNNGLIDAASGHYGVDQFFVGRVANYGTILGGANGGVNQGGAGDFLNGGGEAGEVTLLNGFGGLIAGGAGSYGGNGVVAAQLGSITNFGIVLGGSGGATGTGGQGAALFYNGILTNDGTIAGGAGLTGGYGVYVTGSTLSNFGTILGGDGANPGFGVFVGYGGTVVTGGLIEGGDDGVGSALSSRGGVVDLIVDPGARFVGLVAPTATYQNILDLAGTVAGTLAMGGSFYGFATIAFDNDSAWTLSGDADELAGGETIDGFTVADTLVLTGFDAISDTYVSGTGLILSDGITTETLDITGSFSSGDFSVTANGLGTVIDEVTCFAAGTHIATAKGSRAVERLRIGDKVRTVHAGLQAVRWIGTRSYAAPFCNHRKVLPVTIRAGAIADGIPSRDLTVSPGHAICIDGALVHASRLINGVTIVQAEAVAAITYFHIELETHEVLLAEGCPAESFAGEYFRPVFQNADEYARLYPDGAAPEHLCLPQVTSGFQLAAIQRRLSDRAGIAAPTTSTGPLRGYIDQLAPAHVCGWAQSADQPEAPVCLDILADEKRIGRVIANLYRADVEAAGHGSGFHGFEFAIPPGTAGIISVRRSADGAALDAADGLRQAA